MSEDKRRSELERGARAEALLKDPLLTEALEVMEAQYMKQWRDSKPDDERTRENYYRFIKTLDQFRQHLEQVAQTGDLARKQLREKRSFF